MPTNDAIGATDTRLGPELAGQRCLPVFSACTRNSCLTRCAMYYISRQIARRLYCHKDDCWKELHLRCRGRDCAQRGQDITLKRNTMEVGKEAGGKSSSHKPSEIICDRPIDSMRSRQTLTEFHQTKDQRRCASFGRIPYFHSDRYDAHDGVGAFTRARTITKHRTPSPWSVSSALTYRQTDEDIVFLALTRRHNTCKTRYTIKTIVVAG